ncbi:sensor histidine kinase [Streptomyces sp. WM6378]|uniref:sensor histidine kinase n=1 Tax=Streptomyces sp. WM6378 TaxID=1415557 RepID=UPI000AD988C2|nr:HAMP domain-containing sensor histidine kinase [Streptomyces sp. WM6378]
MTAWQERLRPGWTYGLRWKIVLTVAGVACAVAAILGVLVHNVLTRQRVDEVRKEARGSLDAALKEYAYGTETTDGHGAILDPVELPGALRQLAIGGGRGLMVGEQDGKAVMWAAAPAGGHVLAVSIPYASTRDHLRQMDTAILGSALLAAGSVTLAGTYFAGRISRRLRHTATVARRITEGDLDVRTGIPPGGKAAERDAVTAVAVALDSMAASLQRRLESEKRFTADVAHELRTPLTGMLAAAGLLPEGRPKEMINDRLKALHTLTEDLLEISRLDAGAEQPELAEHELGPLVERAARATALDCDVHVVRDATVRTDRRRLDRIIANLVVNAHRHGAPPVTLTVNGPVVEIRDHGPGYPAELIDRGPQRFRTGDPGRGRGHGLGLTIAAGQAEVLGITLTFSNAATGGAVTTLRLPAA